MTAKPEVISPAFERVTVAAGRSVTLSVLWCDHEGVTHGSAHIAGEGTPVEIPAAMVGALRAEGVIA